MPLTTTETTAVSLFPCCNKRFPRVSGKSWAQLRINWKWEIPDEKRCYTAHWLKRTATVRVVFRRVPEGKTCEGGWGKRVRPWRRRRGTWRNPRLHHHPVERNRWRFGRRRRPPTANSSRPSTLEETPSSSDPVASRDCRRPAFPWWSPPEPIHLRDLRKEMGEEREIERRGSGERGEKEERRGGEERGGREKKKNVTWGSIRTKAIHKRRPSGGNVWVWDSLYTPIW